MLKLTRASVSILLTACLVACSSSPELSEQSTAAQMYAKAKEDLASGAYEDAIKNFEALEARFPYGRFAEQAQLEIAYAYYRHGDNASALAACDRFIRLHPYHPNVDYAYYLKGLASQNVDKSWFTWLSRQDMSERDPKATREALNAFREIVTRFPTSRYAPDAQKRLAESLESLAQYELHVARYYLNRRAPLAAANRAQVVVKTYPDSPAVEEALGIMIAGYDQLKLDTLRDDARRVLQINFPNSRYLKGYPLK